MPVPGADEQATKGRDMTTNRGGRTFTLIHKGDRLVVAEGQDGTVEFRLGKHRETPKAKSFAPACKEAVIWMLTHAGEMKGNYQRD